MPTISGGAGFSSAIFAALTPTESFAQKRQDRQQELIYTQALAKMEEEKLAKVQAMQDAVADTATRAAQASAELPYPDAQRAKQYINAYTSKFEEELRNSGDPYKYYLKEGNNFNKKFIRDFVSSDVLTDGKLNKTTEAQYQDDIANGRYQRPVKSLDPVTGQVIEKTPQQAYNDFISGKTRRLEYNGAHDEPDMSRVYQMISTTPNPAGLKTSKVSFDQFKMAVLASDDVKNKNMSPEDLDKFIKRSWETGGNGLNWNNNQMNYNYEALRTNAEMERMKFQYQKAEIEKQKQAAFMDIYSSFYEGDPSQGIEGWNSVYNDIAKNGKPEEEGYRLLDRSPNPATLQKAVTGNTQGKIASLDRGVYRDADGNLMSYTGTPFSNSVFSAKGIGALKFSSKYPDPKAAGKAMTIIAGTLLVDATDTGNEANLKRIFGDGFTKLKKNQYMTYNDDGTPTKKEYFDVPWDMPYTAINPFIKDSKGSILGRNPLSEKNVTEFGTTQAQFNKPVQ